jgi:hypothetical protein
MHSNDAMDADQHLTPALPLRARWLYLFRAPGANQANCHAAKVRCRDMVVHYLDGAPLSETVLTEDGEPGQHSLAADRLAISVAAGELDAVVFHDPAEIGRTEDLWERVMSECGPASVPVYNLAQTLWDIEVERLASDLPEPLQLTAASMDEGPYGGDRPAQWQEAALSYLIDVLIDQSDEAAASRLHGSAPAERQGLSDALQTSPEALHWLAEQSEVLGASIEELVNGLMMFEIAPPPL